MTYGACVAAGCLAFQTGRMQEACPWAVGTIYRVWWLRGWYDGARAEVEVIFAIAGGAA